ncbi:MAG: zonular occludens toxin domain-containing protein [Pseudomonadota bacterium]
MIVFHEGLPRSGKSYEAIARRIVPALKEGRGVTAYIEGIDHDKLAELAGITAERCRELLQVITAEQAPNWHEHARKNDLVVLDEVQDYFGVRSKLTQAQTKAVTQHGHLGQDIVLMGQDYKDAHVIWRRRIEIKLSFLKLSAIGKEHSYSVTTYRHKGGDEYAKVGVQIHKYDPAFFGSYASHVAADVQKGNYKETRGGVMSNPLLRYVLPVTLVLAVWGIYKGWVFFHPEPNRAVVAAVAPKAQAQAAPVPAAARPVQPAPAQPAPKSDERTPQERLLAELTDKHRIRLAGLIARGERVQGVVEWIDGGTRVIHRMTLDELRNLGAAVVVTGSQAVQLQVGTWREIATSWPLDESLGRMSNSQLAALKPAVEATGAPGIISLGGAAPGVPAKAVEPAGELTVRPTRTVSAPPRS